jgi:hypothetical protein
VAFSTGAIIPATLVQSALRAEPQGLTSLDEAKRAFERDYLIHPKPAINRHFKTGN